jgi:hypothetical protein
MTPGSHVRHISAETIFIRFCRLQALGWVARQEDPGRVCRWIDGGSSAQWYRLR